MEHKTLCKYKVCPYTQHRSLGLVKDRTFFSESSHGLYEINGNEAKSTMHTHILSLHKHSTPLVGSKGHTIFSLKVVILHIKFKGMDHRAPCKRMCFLYTHPRPLGWDQRLKQYFH